MPPRPPRAPRSAPTRSRSPILLITAIVGGIGVVVLGALILFQGGPQGATGTTGLVRPASPTSVALADGRALGKADAPVTLEVWTDFQCPVCGQFARTVEPALVSKYVTPGTLRIVHHDAAFQGARSSSSYDESVEAAAGGRCAADQGGYWPYQDWVFANQDGENQGAFAASRLTSIASASGLDRHGLEGMCRHGDPSGGGPVGDGTGPRGGRRRHPDDAAQRPDDRRPAERHRAGRAHRSGGRGGGQRRVTQEETVGGRGRFGLALTAIALAGLGIAAYLFIARVLGEAPACGPVKGCETVAASEYATVLGIPVALFGVAFSVILAGACLVWWRQGDRRALYVAYGLGLAGIITVVYLTYLELFVIEAICVWCVSYAITIVAGWVIVAFTAWSTSD